METPSRASARCFANGTGVRVGEWTFNPATRRLERDELERRLDAKQVAVLLHLIESSPQPVSIQTLLDRSWHGVVVGDNAVHRVIGQLRKALGDSRHAPTYIETLPKQGYRLIARVSFDASPNDEALGGADGNVLSGETEPAAPSVRRTGWRPLGFAAIGLTLSAAVMLFSTGFLQPGDEEVAEKATPLVTVRPLRHPGDDPALQELAFLVAERTLTHLSRIPTLAVSGGDGPADYTLSGSVRRFDRLPIVSVQLTRSADGRVLWARSFEKVNEDFRAAALVSRMVEAVVGMRWIESLRGVNAAVRRELREGFVEWHEYALGAGGNMRVAASHLERVIQLAPELWPAHMQLTILYANRAAGPLAKSLSEAHRVAGALLELRRNNHRYPVPVEWAFPIALVSQRLDLDYEFAATNLVRARDEQGADMWQVETELASIDGARGDLHQAIARYGAAAAGGAQLDQTAAQFGLGWMQLAAGRYEIASRSLARALDTASPGSDFYLLIQFARIMALHHAGEVHRARATADEIWGHYGERAPELFPVVYALLGPEDEARRLLAYAEDRYRQRRLEWCWPGFLASFHLGDTDAAFQWLDRVIDNREFIYLPHVRGARYLEPLRRDERYTLAMTRLEELEARSSPLRALLAAEP